MVKLSQYSVLASLRTSFMKLDQQKALKWLRVPFILTCQEKCKQISIALGNDFITKYVNIIIVKNY